ncbi:NAD(P)-dependent oxidoreductase [Polaromonas sp.]|uniref:NAD-dependent epimerase/dehydratase family protein n=1 Tax=Polaromonas sp. TaxID=1869339 RepID=UPI0027306590|nr:NAD(P)-dependent oxidoreductase [Polaromonas sp.]MDP1740197.1 NAD(P)-dependent oxidoreductase [Polaromonas sp.]
MKVLVTGASGFIGRHCVAQLHAKGYEVHAVSSAMRDAPPGVTWHGADLLADGEAAGLVRRIGATHLLHLAWCTQPGKYWTALENFDWLRASLAMIQAFTAIGGKRLVAAGTCAEYDWHGGGICAEATTPLVPGTLYGSSKHALQLQLAAWSRQTGLSSAWGRVFSLYGPHEHPQRLMASTISSLMDGNTATCGNPGLVRDYLHAEDVASAFVALLECELAGPVNIGSGHGVALGDIVTAIGQKLGAVDRVRLPSVSVRGTEPALLVAETSKLALTGWTPKFDLDRGLDDTIAWWRAQPRATLR